MAKKKSNKPEQQDADAQAPLVAGSQDGETAPSPVPQMELGLEQEADHVRRRVEEALGASPIEMDELIRQTGAPSSIVLTVILELELAGRCRRHPGNRVSWATLPAG